MAAATVRVRVWDRFVRLFHWSLVACVALDSFALDGSEAPHHWAGYAAAALVGARIAWGFVGSRYARFSQFFPTPTRIREHLVHLRNREPAASPGHNALGAVMMLALMAVVMALGITGWMQGLDRYFGEEWLMDLHEQLADALIALVVLHVAAAVVMSAWEKTNLIGAMITGWKQMPGKRR
jgi:cytochrome b